MTNEEMTNEERANSDKLNSYFSEDKNVHLTLIRKLPDGRSVWLNGKLIRQSSERVWILQERVLGEIRVSISEIKDVEEEK
jgi:hypothetical protein